MEKPSTPTAHHASSRLPGVNVAVTVRTSSSSIGTETPACSISENARTPLATMMTTK